MTKQHSLFTYLESERNDLNITLSYAYDEVTVQCDVSALLSLLSKLRQNKDLAFDQLIDICGVDYLHYGLADWETEHATTTGFSRAVAPRAFQEQAAQPARFAVVYHLLSTAHNHRVRVKVFLEEPLVVPSAHHIWKSANWFEREAYDLFGILFSGHPDLRRILTDYGFIGHPFRKDFPLSGHVEMRYDAHLQKVIYEPVDIEPRILEPKVIRHEHHDVELQENAL